VITPSTQVEFAWELGADLVIPEGATATESIQAVRYLFGGGADTAIDLAGDLSVAAGVIRPGGKFTSVADSATRVIGSDVHYVPTIVAPSGHKLADLLFKAAAHRLHSQVGQTISFDQATNAVNPGSNVRHGRIVVVR
jgi:NADPH:quinone reductase-like Zn-dependent oxidoreductase